MLPTALAQLPSRRSGVPDQWLTQVLTEATTRLRSHLGQPQRRALAARDVAEMLQLMTLESAPIAAAAAQAAAADLPGRQSGAEAWRQARGETREHDSQWLVLHICLVAELLPVHRRELCKFSKCG